MTAAANGSPRRRAVMRDGAPRDEVARAMAKRRRRVALSWARALRRALDREAALVRTPENDARCALIERRIRAQMAEADAAPEF